MPIFKNTKKNLVTTSVFATVSVGVYIFFIFMALKERTLFEQNVSVLENGSTEERKAESVRAILKDTEEARTELKKRLVGAEEVDLFLDFLGRTADVGGAELTIKTVEIQKHPEGFVSTTTEPIALSLDASGSFSSVYNFIALLDTAPYKMQINNVSLSLEGDASDSEPKLKTPTTPRWKALIKLIVFKAK